MDETKEVVEEVVVEEEEEVEEGEILEVILEALLDLQDSVDALREDIVRVKGGKF